MDAFQYPEGITLRAHVKKRKYETPADRYPKINNAHLA